MRLKYEPSSEPFHTSAKQALFAPEQDSNPLISLMFEDLSHFPKRSGRPSRPRRCRPPPRRKSRLCFNQETAPNPTLTRRLSRVSSAPQFTFFLPYEQHVNLEPVCQLMGIAEAHDLCQFPKTARRRSRLCLTLLLFLITLEPRIEWYTSLCALNSSPSRNRFTFLRSRLCLNQDTAPSP